MEHFANGSLRFTLMIFCLKAVTLYARNDFKLVKLKCGRLAAVADAFALVAAAAVTAAVLFPLLLLLLLC